MKKLVTLVMALACTAAIAAPVDSSIAKVNASFEAAKSASPALAERIATSQNAWTSWADQDCKARLGIPANAAASLNEAKYGSCMAEQMERRAVQLSQYACASDNRFCSK